MRTVRTDGLNGRSVRTDYPYGPSVRTVRTDRPYGPSVGTKSLKGNKERDRKLDGTRPELLTTGPDQTGLELKKETTRPDWNAAVRKKEQPDGINQTRTSLKFGKLKIRSEKKKENGQIVYFLIWGPAFCPLVWIRG